MKYTIANKQADGVGISVIDIKFSQEFDSLEEEGNDKLTSIEVLAYYKAEARGYEPGHEMQDWLNAEVEIMGKKRLKHFSVYQSRLYW